MSITSMAHLASHLNNITKARLSVGNTPNSKTKLRLCLAMQRQGLLSSVTVAGQNPPASIPPTHGEIMQLADSLADEPWEAYPDPSLRHEPARIDDELPPNPADRRIWIGLKYWRGKSVLENCKIVSKPSRRISVEPSELEHIVRGRRQPKQFGVKRARPWSLAPMVNPGECIFIRTTEGVFEAREALEKRLGGEVLIRTGGPKQL